LKNDDIIFQRLCPLELKHSYAAFSALGASCSVAYFTASV
jgi:hypothetical protein